jgi:hypothetical protein
MARPKKTEPVVEDVVSNEEEVVKPVKETKKLTEIIELKPSSKSKSNPKLQKFIDEETVLVKGRFKMYESPGGSVKIIVKKYPGIPQFEKLMFDGEMYEVPLYVARHLNGIDVTAGAINGKLGTCSYAIHGFQTPEKGGTVPCHLNEAGVPIPVVGVAKRVRRYGFESLQFDIE